ncbi:MAG: ABC transporter ATP-binding protein [Thermoanaerobaculia bacterium]|nr:ABC transporter ATP-binding protein [Thermoanaerobaculia bacterium]
MRAVDETTVLRARNLVKRYRRTTAGHQLRTLKSALLQGSLVAGLDPKDAIVAVDDVSFDLLHGQSVGLIGSNGSGKSTLLKMLAGILRPTSGSFEVDGRVAALIELGAGFHPEISGRENVYINGAVLGLSKQEVDERFDDIVGFSGLGDFIEEPVKNYSSGMYVRLGFSVAVHTDPDVLIVDEVLAVGDEAFAHRCIRRIEEFLRRGKSLVMVSHSLGLVEEICDRVLWLEKGRLLEDGHPRRVIDAYRESVADAEAAEHRQAMVAREGEASEEDDDEAQETLRWGSRLATIERVRVLVASEDGTETERYHVRCGDDVILEIQVDTQDELDDFVFGVGLFTPRGVEIWGTNTELGGYEPEQLAAGRSTIRLRMGDLRLAPGEYLLDVAVHAEDGTPYDYRRKLVELSVTAGERGVGVYFPRHEWYADDAVRWTHRPSSSDD